MENKEPYMGDINEKICTCCRTETQETIILSLEEEVKGLKNINLERERIYRLALENYGAEPQINMVFEEMAELQKELCKYLRNMYSGDIKHLPKIAEEIADVEIMLDQMKLLFDIEDGVDKFKTIKMERLKERLR